MKRSLKTAIASISLCALFLTGCDNPNHDDNNGIDTDHQVDDSRGEELKDDPLDQETAPGSDD